MTLYALYLVLSVQSHSLFRRDGDDIVYELPLNVAQATLGDEVVIPTLEGDTTLKVPAGTQTGRVFKLKGKGLASVRGHGIGDEEVKVVVETPTHLSEKQKELLEQFAQISGEKVNPLSHSFMEKVKGLFS